MKLLPPETSAHLFNPGYLLSWKLPAFALGFFIRRGNLTIKCDGLDPLHLGDGSGPAYVMNVKSPTVLKNIFRDPDLYMGESYMDGDWSLVQGDLGAFLTMLLHNERLDYDILPLRLMTKNPAHHLNDIHHSRENAQSHYNLGNDLYEVFLDENMNYSCAFFDTQDMPLVKAQQNKINKAIERLDIQPDANVLDIGCGWGHTCREIARQAQASAICGITLSENQVNYAQTQHVPERDRKRLSYLLCDYREYAQTHENANDRIISIGMFEHVGEKQHLIFFETLKKLLKPGGKALIHTILRPDPIKGPTTLWLDKYIFPGGCIPYLPDMLKKAKQAGLQPVTDPYIHGSYNYAETLRRWRTNFRKNAAKLDPETYNRRFMRMWNYYLASCEAAFDGMGLYVGQVILKPSN